MPREKTCAYPSRYVYLGRLMPDASASVLCQLSMLLMLQIQCARSGARRISVQDLDCQCPPPAALNLRAPESVCGRWVSATESAPLDSELGPTGDEFNAH